MTDSTPEAVTRRNFFRGKFTSRPDRSHGWHAVDGLAAMAGDVFWDGWADDQGVFIVGDDGAILHYDGDRWSRHAAPAPVPIHALWGTSRQMLWAVGWMGLILRYDGETWQKIQGCDVDGAGKYSSAPVNTPLFDVAGLPDGRVWAVGDRGTILHLDGDAWMPEASGTRAHLRSIVALDGDRLLAAGLDGTVLVRSAEGRWDRLDCPIHSNFTAALPLEGPTVLLAGGRYFLDANGFRGDLVLFDGTAFRKFFEGATFSRFRALARYDEGVVTVGDGGQIHLIREDRIDRVASGTSHDLLGIITLPSGEALAVGDFGTVMAGDQVALETFAPAVTVGGPQPDWESLDSGTDRQLWGLWHDSQADTVYACGEEGTVLCLDRGRWEALPPVGKLGVHALERAPDGGLFAAGQLGEIHHFDGSVWRKAFDLHIDVTLLALWSDGAGGLFACGDEGLVLTWTGQTWERATSGTKSALYGLWGLDAEHLLAVGDFGLILRWNGKTWDEFNAGTEHFLFDVWGRALDDIFVVGLSGTIGHFDGQRWRITPARARNDLLAVTGTALEVVAVGAGGAAVRYDGAQWQTLRTGTTAGLRAVTATPSGQFYAAGDAGTLLASLSG